MEKISQIKLSDDFLVFTNRVLGKGSTGSVYEGLDLRNNKTVAVKVIDLTTIDNEVTKYLLQMEKTALMALDSPYILKGIRVLQDQKFCFIVTQFCNGGTLKKYIQSKGKLSQLKSLEIIKCILEGYQKLVLQGITHRDLKPANIMLHNDKPKIIDFGYCEIEGFKKPKLQYNVGSPSYMAPQSFQANVYNQKTEIWAIGVILYECVTGRTLDQGQKMTKIYKKIKQQGIPYPDHLSQSLRNIINWCLQLEPKSRPSCSELISVYFPQKPQFTRSFSTFSTCSTQNEKTIFKNKEISLTNSYKFVQDNNVVNTVKKQKSDWMQRKPSFSFIHGNTVKSNVPVYIPQAAKKLNSTKSKNISLGYYPTQKTPCPSSTPWTPAPQRSPSFFKNLLNKTSQNPKPPQTTDKTSTSFTLDRKKTLTHLFPKKPSPLPSPLSSPFALSSKLPNKPTFLTLTKYPHPSTNALELGKKGMHFSSNSECNLHQLLNHVESKENLQLGIARERGFQCYRVQQRHNKNLSTYQPARTPTPEFGHPLTQTLDHKVNQMPILQRKLSSSFRM